MLYALYFMNKRSLFNKIFLSMLIAPFLMGAIFLLAMTREQNKNQEAEVIESGLMISRAIAEDIRKGNLDNLSQTHFFKEIIANRNIVFSWVVRPDGQVYFANDPGMIGKRIEDPLIGTKEEIVKDSVYFPTGEKVKLIMEPLEMAGDGKVWNLFIGFSSKSIWLSQGKMIFFGLGLFSLAIVFIFIASFFIVKKIIKPIKKLKEGADIIGKGNFSYQLNLATGDELEDLGEALNKMARDLNNYYTSLAETKDVLEIRVNARTKQIREMAEGLEEKVKERTEVLLKSRKALLNMLEDVDAERKIAEEEKNKTSAIVANFADGLLLLSDNNKISLVNPRAEKFFRIKEKDVVGKSFSELTENYSIKLLAGLFSENGKELDKKEVEIRSGIFLEINAISIFREGRQFGLLVILHDISREKMVEKIKTEFVSLAAHQLRTPLSAIKWTIGMFLEGSLGKMTKEQNEFLADTYKLNEKMIILINDLLNATRIEEGRYLYSPSLVDIVGMVNPLVEFSDSEAKKRKINFSFKNSIKGPMKILIDGEKVKIALENVLNNAIRYTPSGGAVAVYLKNSEKEIEFSIEDTGVGIPEDQQARVFSKFFRGTNVVKMETEGTGLGLFIVKNVIEAHGGKTWFESEEGKGTKFYLTIPIKK